MITSTGLLGASLPEAFLGLLTIIACVVGVALAFVFIIDLILAIVAPNSKGIFFRRHNNGDKVVVAKSKKSGKQETVTSYDDEPEVIVPEETKENSWDESKVNQEQEDLLAGLPGLDDFDDLEQKQFSQEREEAIKNRKKEFDDFDKLYDDNDSDIDAEDLNKLIDEVNAESVRIYKEGGDGAKALTPDNTNDSLDLDSMLGDVKLDDSNPSKVESSDALDLDSILPNEIENKDSQQKDALDDLIFDEETKSQEPSQDALDLDNVFSGLDINDQKDEKSNKEDIKLASVDSPEIVFEENENSTKEPIVETKSSEQQVIVETKEVKEEPVVVDKKQNILPLYVDATLEQLQNRLEKLQDRLKANEKDLKANRKEYLPLARVRKTLDKDQAKLRRREATIARKKVILYGVNNYVDIDEEKAKKLSEDLDLLDGLRLSVQHCEDVMNANKDRFPILEMTNRILVNNKRDIQEDIEEVEKAIEKYKNNNN